MNEISYPHRYPADRICPGCARHCPVEVTVWAPDVVSYRCGRGHEWFATSRKVTP